MKKSFLITLAVVLFSAALFSAYQLWRYSADEQETEEQFSNLSARIELPTPSTSEQPPAPGEISPEWTINDQYGLLFDQNPDMIGWIAIDGTGIDYPVMQTPDKSNYYLNHNFEKQHSDHGVPYAAESASIDPQSDNITLYGHHMKGARCSGAWKATKARIFGGNTRLSNSTPAPDLGGMKSSPRLR